MKFLHQTFEAQRSEIIEVEIDKPTKVKFMTGRDLKAYKLGKTHTYYGGMFEESPVRFVVPYDGKWTVVVEKGTYSAPLDVTASCQLTVPNPHVTSTVAIDAPPGSRDPDPRDLDREDVERHATELSLAARSEG
jgi:hypothetical protein